MSKTGQSPMKNPLEELTELVKNVGEQTGAKSVSFEQPQMVQPEAPLPQPSLLEKRKDRIIMANKAEIDEMITRQRHQRENVVQQEEMIEEKQEEQVKEEKKKSWREKGLDFVKKRAMHQIEGRPPKAP